MRKVVERFNVYKFEELSEKGQQLALGYYWSINVDYEWWNCAYDDVKYSLGIEIKSFDLGRRQSLEADIYCPIATAESALENYGKESEIYQLADKFLNDIKDLNEDSEEIEEFYVEFEKDLKWYLFRLLDSEYNYLTSEEAIKDTLILNDYEFTENGRIY